jgi:hypothetical protein
MSNGKGKKRDLARIIASKMAGAAPQIDAVRSTKGEIKGFFSQDTMFRLRQAVADHEKAGTDTRAEARLAVILGLCDTYLHRHGAETDDRAKEKLEAVDRIQQQAMTEMRDWGHRQAELRYIRDVQVGATDVRDQLGQPEPDDDDSDDVDDVDEPDDSEDSQPRERAWKGTQYISQGASVTAVMETTKLAKGQTAANGKDGFNQATLDLIKQYGLTEAEVLAVKVYTADDYKYINPATNPSTPWNDAKLRRRAGQNKPEGYVDTKKGQKKLRQLKEEGSLHGALGISAVKKLPPKAGLVYRGMRLTEAEFQQQFGNGLPPDETLLQLTSFATEEANSLRFANGEGNTSNPDKTVSVMMDVTVETGRDVGDLSVFGHDEKEWLLLPGAVLVTTEIKVAETLEDSVNGSVGNPPATKWVRITQNQK